MLQEFLVKVGIASSKLQRGREDWDIGWITALKQGIPGHSEDMIIVNNWE